MIHIIDYNSCYMLFFSESSNTTSVFPGFIFWISTPWKNAYMYFPRTVLVVDLSSTAVEEFIEITPKSPVELKFREEIFLLHQPRTSADQRAVQRLCKAHMAVVHSQSKASWQIALYSNILIQALKRLVLSQVSS